MSFLGHEEQVRELQDRFRWIYPTLFLAIAILVSRLIYLQVITGDKMRRYSEENRIKKVEIPAPRGMVFDRNRQLLLDNRPAFDLEITPQYLKESGVRDQVLTRLSLLIEMPISHIENILKKFERQPSFLPVKIKTDLTRDEVAKLETWKLDMPGVSVEMEIKRTNLFGDIAAHLLGYIGEVTSNDLPKLSKQNNPYRLGDQIGKSGIEKQLEKDLRGQDGLQLIEVDAIGRRIRTKTQADRVLSAQEKEIPSVPGHNLVLTVDQDLQTAAANAFGDKAGGLVAIRPSTGEILAMISRPAFDPTEFSRGISNKLWKELISNEKRPLRDKTIQDHYSPGSVFKTVTAIAGLEEGIINENTTFHCPGFIQVGNRIYHCHKKHGHGEVNVVKALIQSCDVFFYRVAQKFNSVDVIAKWASLLGLGKKTGIPLEREVSGLVPTEAWKKAKLNQEWNLGETLSIAIGQSFLLTTPIQLANLYASLANGGTLYRPYIIQEIQDTNGNTIEKFEPQALTTTRLKPKTVELIEEGLAGVVNSPKGTAYYQRLKNVEYAGKTGTVQIMRIAADKIYQRCENLKYSQRHHGIFAGFAPSHNPEIAVAIVAEHACHGSSGAAPIARAVIKTYFEKYHPELFKTKEQTTAIIPAGVTESEDVVPDLHEIKAPEMPQQDTTDVAPDIIEQEGD